MTQSNSKLDCEQKEILREMKSEFSDKHGQIFSFHENGVTIAIMQAFAGANTIKVATSVASPDEKKFRRKVGEYHALANMLYNDKFIVLPDIGLTFEETADNIAHATAYVG